MATYDDFERQPEPKKKQTSILWIVLIVVAVVVGGCCCCCGGGYFFGIKALATGLRPEVEQSEPVIEHIGDVQEFELDMWKTVEIQEKYPEHIAFTISGTKGSGVVVIKAKEGPAAQPGDMIDKGKLVLPTGQEFDLKAEEDGAGMPDDSEEPAKPADEAAPTGDTPAESTEGGSGS